MLFLIRGPISGEGVHRSPSLDSWSFGRVFIYVLTKMWYWNSENWTHTEWNENHTIFRRLFTFFNFKTIVYGWTMLCYNPAFTLTDVAGSKKGYVLSLVLVLKEYDDFFLLDGFSVLWRILTKKSYICLTLRTLGKKLCPVWEYGMLCIIRCPYTTNPGLAARLHHHFF